MCMYECSFAYAQTCIDNDKRTFRARPIGCPVTPDFRRRILCHFAVNVIVQNAFYICDNCAFTEFSVQNCGVDSKPSRTEYAPYRWGHDSNTWRKPIKTRLKVVRHPIGRHPRSENDNESSSQPHLPSTNSSKHSENALIAAIVIVSGAIFPWCPGGGGRATGWGVRCAVWTCTWTLTRLDSVRLYVCRVFRSVSSLGSHLNEPIERRNRKSRKKNVKKI